MGRGGAGGMENFGQSMENERIHEQILSLSHEISDTGRRLDAQIEVFRLVGPSLKDWLGYQSPKLPPNSQTIFPVSVRESPKK